MSVETDRELLEQAAKAAGYVIDEHARNGSAWAWVYPFGAKPDGDGDYPIFKWNPLHDDGDALRLGAKLQLRTLCTGVGASAESTHRDHPAIFAWGERLDSSDAEASAATRRAIVRAAAEIGRAMP